MAILAALTDLYRGIYVGLPGDWSSYKAFRSCLDELDLKSSPGYPYSDSAPTIGEWLKATPLREYDEDRVEQLWYDVRRVMAGDFEHIFRVFVKNEPHKIAKVKAKRWRLIIASALSVQMVWRMLFRHQNDALNAHPYETPSKHGTVFCYGGWRRFLAYAHSKSLRYSRDISGWDVNAPGWALHLVGEWRALWPGITSEWRRIKDLLYKDAFSESKLLFSSGVVLKQQFDGFMKSGIYNTISDNTVAMVAMHILACLRSGMIFGSFAATGDDVIQSNVSDSYLEELEKAGCRVKEVHSHLEFMGMDFSKGSPEPLYFPKHVVSFATKTGLEEEVLDAYARLYTYSDKFPYWKRVAELLGISLRPQSYYRFWYSSPLAAVMSRLMG